MKRRIRNIVTVFMIVLAAVCAADGFAAPFDEIVVFGDSLSDNGNLLLVDNQPRPDPAIYYQGRFSNGPVWVEYLANQQHFNVSLDDRALGGAQSSGLVPPGLYEQVTAYIATTVPPLSHNTLFVLWIGGNDFLNGNGDWLSAVGNIRSAMERLVEYEARQILVMNLPDLGAIPDTLGTPEAPLATEFTNNFNAELANMLDQFRVDHPEIALYEFDVYSFFIDVRSNPAAYGFVNVTDPSPNYQVENNFNGAGYLFWDDIHPTTEMHALLADQVYADVSAQMPVAPPAGDNNGGGSSGCFIDASIW